MENQINIIRESLREAITMKDFNPSNFELRLLSKGLNYKNLPNAMEYFKLQAS